MNPIQRQESCKLKVCSACSFTLMEVLLQVASNAMFAATILGLAVLIAEFTSKMNAVSGILVCSSTRSHRAQQVCYTKTSMGFDKICMQDASATRFKHKTVSIWNVAVGGVCLMLMSAILIVFAWRIGQARWQNKIWCACHGLWAFIASTTCRH